MSLDSFLSAARDLLGDAHVVSDEAGVSQRAKDIIPSVFQPSAFLYPANRDDVAEIVRLANVQRVSLWPVSKGQNWGYGAATPARDGTVVMVLERMNRIHEVNQELAYAVVEPGVTYRQLHQHLEANGLPLWLDCTDGPADASVVGNSLERGVGETDYGDHFGNICGLEAVLPDGTIVQTGGGSIDGHRAFNTYKWGVGPYLEGLFSQSNYGIVTKMGVWLMPKPEYFASCLFELRHEEEFPALIDALRRLQLNGAIKSKVHLINDVISFAVAFEHPRELLQGAECLTDARRAEIRRTYGIAPWTFAAGLYGTKSQVRANIALIKRELGRLGTLLFVDDRGLRIIEWATRGLRGMERTALKGLANFVSRRVVRKPVSLLEFLPHVHAVEKGYPSDYFVKHAYFKNRRPKPAGVADPARDNCGLIWLGPMIPLVGSEVSQVLATVRQLYAKHRLDFSTALMVGNPRTVIALMSVFYDRDDPGETERAKALYFEMGEVTQRAGYQQYRTSTMYMDRVLAPAPEFQALCNRIKQALDPNGVIAPGKYGVG